MEQNEPNPTNIAISSVQNAVVFVSERAKSDNGEQYVAGLHRSNLFYSPRLLAKSDNGE